jgi:thioesterase domain-containing protein
MMTAAEIEAYLHEKIPLARAMEVQVAECNDTRLMLTAPLAPNRNHLQTAFGGSLQALAILSGYSLLWRLLDNPEAHIVIRESTIRYERPVKGELRAVCSAPSFLELTRFQSDFARKGKARIILEAVIEQGGEAAVLFRGVFVALR